MSNELTKKNEEVKPVENIEVMPPVDITEDNECLTMYFEVPGSN